MPDCPFDLEAWLTRIGCEWGPPEAWRLTLEMIPGNERFTLAICPVRIRRRIPTWR